MGERTNKISLAKTFRFEPEVIEGAERVICLTQIDGKPKYPSMTNFVVTAMQELIKKERGVLEHNGVVWDHLKPSFKQSFKEE